jgi:hypothetical protein
MEKAMAFYYPSIFGLVPLAIAYGLLAFVYWIIVVGTRGDPRRGLILSVLGAVFLVLPVGEELWIGWNFGQACKGAGTFITKKVQTDGFYDASMRAAYENTKPGRYQFVEQATEDSKGFERVERVEDESRSKALAWYSGRNPGKSLPNSIVYPVDDNIRIVVSLSSAGAWKVTKLDRPTARYHFKNTDPMSGTPWGHKIGRSGSVVIDTQSNEEIARYASFGRRPPWFYIGLGVAPYSCDSPGDWPNSRRSSLIYREVLIPTGRKGAEK